jgi:aminopeptidase S
VNKKVKKKLYLSAAIASVLLLNACSTAPIQPQLTTSTEVTDSLEQRLMTHLNQLEKIAAQHGGNRAVGTEGGKATAAYILTEAKKSGFNAEILPFENRNKIVGQNIIVEIKGQNPNQATMIGAHYDSVTMGPGINDNGTGVAVLLELIKQQAETKNQPKNTLYFAFWDSEEEGIGGSQDFVKKMSAEQLKGINAYINVDMVGTKDPNILVADVDKSSLKDLEAQFISAGLSEPDYKPMIDGLKSLPSHPGDTVLEEHLKSFFKAQNLTIKEDITTLTASDTAPFLGKVPVTSIILFNEKERPGANEGETILDFAPCYHQVCDTSKHVDPKSMVLTINAIQHLLKALNTQ